MERKKTRSGGKATRRTSARRKKRKISLAEIRMNLILLAAILGVSALLFFGRAFFVLSTASESGHNPVAEATPPVTVPDLEAGQGSGQAAPVSDERPMPETKPADTRGIPAQKQPVATANQVPPVVQAPAKAPARGGGPKLVAAAPRSPPKRPIPEKPKGQIVFVFDDAGHNLAQLRKFLDLPFPCTIAVLPGLQYSSQAAREIRAAGKECILHQPMQAINLQMDPGPGAIRAGMMRDQIMETVRKNLREIGPVSGVNNHEGSLITADKDAMAAVLDVVEEAGIYYLDSRTNAATMVPSLARERNMKIWERAVFLDNSQDREMIVEAVTGGMKIAERQGSAIMIGHIWSNQLADILNEMYPELVSQGFSLSTIAQIATSGEMGE